jgi:hypothetical protein
MSAAIAIPFDGLEYEDYIEVEGETFRASANGPSFCNALGKLELARVNGGASITGGIARDGSLSIRAMSMDSSTAVAFGEMCASDGFRDVVDAVKKGR